METAFVIDGSLRRSEEMIRLRDERQKLMAPYLDLVKNIKDSLPADSPDLELAENLRHLIEISSLETLQAAELLTHWHMNRPGAPGKRAKHVSNHNKV